MLTRTIFVPLLLIFLGTPGSCFCHYGLGTTHYVEKCGKEIAHEYPDYLKDQDLELDPAVPSGATVKTGTTFECFCVYLSIDGDPRCDDSKKVFIQHTVTDEDPEAVCKRKSLCEAPNGCPWQAPPES